MGPKADDTKKNPVAILRERFLEKLRNWKPSPELEDAIREKKPAEKNDKTEQPLKKIARQKPREDLDL